MGFLFSLSGRVARLPFIAFVIGVKLAIEAIGYAQRQYMPPLPIDDMMIAAIPGVITLILMWPLFAVTVKRLHDIEWPAVLALVQFIPLIGIVIFFTRSQYYTADAEHLARMFEWAGIGLNIMALISFGLFLLLAVIPGVNRTNRFGPPPGVTRMAEEAY
ncbi:DUF805 domain-containing protein [Asticcacaulis sp. ZE23SCel15]|jgi:uncharacterized membrane protein YhaH (DUF805 family)|uniref:DUF805 domain-containing protein n=1 Tax=Asticcacaulis sp. ZE23SCel15 TaxID=3059027 RepID=UPI00265FA2AE|nr:DUF805 domain-containing protein [Asticcacaulis sp. ZE23SCel15]WKL56146.1 DUF805 domain-containing protein [Asticcacaulis sp. ZE23SCel15]